jgi:RNA polymerase sigma-70 factor (TIGR02960 family)
MTASTEANRDQAEAALVAAARRGDEVAFEALVAAYRNPLHAYCYRMLGSVHDADDGLQETLLAAWRGLPGFEGRSSLRSWLYRIATHACLRLAATRRRRALAPGYGSSQIWLEPYPETGADPAAGPDSDPAARYVERENVELALVAAMQYLPPAQRAVLILHDVFQFSAPEVAQVLDRSVASVNSALQRARGAAGRQAGLSRQHAELAALGDPGQRELVEAFVAAWEQADVTALVALLADDVRFTMPPLPAWFDGRADVVRLFTQRLWTTSWRLVPVWASGQLAFACYHGPLASACYRGQPQDEAEGPLQLSALNVLTLRGGQIAELTGFLDPAVHRRFGLAQEFFADRDEVSGPRVSLPVSGTRRRTREERQCPAIA